MYSFLKMHLINKNSGESKIKMDEIALMYTDQDRNIAVTDVKDIKGKFLNRFTFTLNFHEIVKLRNFDRRYFQKKSR